MDVSKWIALQADEYGAAVSGLWIQDWSGKIVTDLGTRVFWNWRWNETWYPDLDTVIQVRNPPPEAIPTRDI